MRLLGSIETEWRKSIMDVALYVSVIFILLLYKRLQVLRCSLGRSGLK